MSYRVWNIINPPNGEVKYYSVLGPIQAQIVIEALAQQQLTDDTIVCNAFGLETDETGEWEEWVNGVGESIDEAEFDYNQVNADYIEVYTEEI